MLIQAGLDSVWSVTVPLRSHDLLPGDPSPGCREGTTTDNATATLTCAGA